MNFQILSWFASACSLAGMYVVGKKIWWGWLFNIATLPALVYINLHFHLWGFLPCNAVVFVIFVKNAVQWRRSSCE